MGDRRGAYRILERRPEGKRTLGILKRRWENNNKMVLHEVGWGIWIGLIWLKTMTGGGAVVKAAITFRFHTMRGIS